MYSPIHDSLLNKTQLSLEMARKHLNNFYNNNITRNKSSSAYRTPINNNSKYFYSPKINTIKPRAKTKQKLVSKQVNNIIQNNRIITNLNIGLSNKLNTLNNTSDNNYDYEINKKQKELVDLSRQLEKELRYSNDKNFEILHSYEKLKAKIDQINKENKIFEEEIKQNDDFTLKIKNENIELKNNINNILSNYENQNKEIFENYNVSKKDYKNSFEKYETLVSVNKSLEKTKSDMKDVIYKMKDTINFLEKKKSLVTYDVDIIERKIRDRNIEIEIRDNQLNNLMRNYDLLRKESIENNNILQNTMYEFANENNNTNERFEQIKQSLKVYDMKIIQLLNAIRERDKDIEEIKIQYKMINDKLEKKRQLFNNYVSSINNNSQNIYNNNQNKYSITTIPEESNFETIDNDEKKNIINSEIKKLNVEKMNKENIFNDIKEKKNYNINNNEINNFENKENNEDKNNLNQEFIDNNYKLEKNNSQTLLDENKKLQEEYKQLIKDNINPIIEGKFSDKNQENSKEIYEENKEDNNEENREENKEETNEETKEENKEESKEEESKNMSNIS